MQGRLDPVLVAGQLHRRRIRSCLVVQPVGAGEEPCHEEVRCGDLRDPLREVKGRRPVEVGAVRSGVSGQLQRRDRVADQVLALEVGRARRDRSRGGRRRTRRSDSPASSWRSGADQDPGTHVGAVLRQRHQHVPDEQARLTRCGGLVQGVDHHGERTSARAFSVSASRMSDTTSSRSSAQGSRRRARDLVGDLERRLALGVDGAGHRPDRRPHRDVVRWQLSRHVPVGGRDHPGQDRGLAHPR